MKEKYRRWVYHATKQPKIIMSDEFEKHEAMVWADSPAKFAKIKDFGVDEDDLNSVQVLGEAIEGVKDAANGALNIDVMKKQELEDYAFKHFGIDIDKRRSVKKLRDEVKKLVGI